MFDQILVPLDGSVSSEAALPYARALAERTRGRITLFRAASASPTLRNISERQDRAMEESGRYLSALAERLRGDGLRVDTTVGYGVPAQSIIGEITSRKIDLVVMATHDPTGRRRWARGSVVENVIGHSDAPVLVVRASSVVAMADRFRAQRPVLTVPLDGSELAEAALPVARDVAGSLGARLVLVGVVVHVGQPIPVRRGAPASLAEQDFGEVQQEARTYLATISSQLSPEVDTTSALCTGEPGAEINRAAEEHGAAAIVMATHGRTGMLRTLLGSVARQVVHSGSTPVLLVRPTEAHARGGRESRRIGWGVVPEDSGSRRSAT
jgi:nucleotide-binding universal stress UspA family protein